MRDRGEALRTVYESLGHPSRRASHAGRASLQGRFRRCFAFPILPVRSPKLATPCQVAGPPRFTASPASVEWALIRHREAILDRQLVQQPIAEATMELLASLCVLSRRDAELHADGNPDQPASWEPATAVLFLTQSARRIRHSMGRIHDYDDESITRTAGRILGSDQVASRGCVGRDVA